jgi:iron complex transport system ATP-binding protein
VDNNNSDIFSVNGVSFSYGRLKAVDNLSLSLSSGNFWGILGPNGCGKSTLLDLLARCRQPESGTIRYRGRDMAGFSKKDMAREIALVPQDYYINFSFTVKEIVLMGRHPYIPRFAVPAKHDLEIVDRVMALLKIDKFKDKYITDLSGGEKQRVIFARALTQDTPVLLLDEATSNMDIQYTLDLLDTVALGVGKQRKTVVAVLHNLNLAAAYCDKLIMMKDGKVVCAGTIDEILTEENLYKVFGIESHIYFDDYSGSKQIVFKRGQR